MDAKDRLRRYLEQRRELGESEFVLDTLSVEDVMRMVGVRGASAARAETRGDSRADTRADTRAEARAASRLESRPETAADAPESAPAAAPPPAPSVRFSGDASTDWRSTLQAEAPQGARPAPVPVPAAGGRTELPPWLAALGAPAGLEAGRLQVAELLPEVAASTTLEHIAAHVTACQRCGLHKTARNAVPGEGNPQAEVLCVGEAPGANEDEQGRPFVGEAGQLLNKILGAIQLTRDGVYICNVLKHRPPGNRDPLPDEVAACQPYLLRQIELVKPKVIIAWGRFAAQTLMQTTTGIGQLRGQIHRYHGVPLIVTYHPAALLRNEAWKRPTWEDVKLARRVLDAARDAAGPSVS
ncbi:MAG: uracil-DNA glycosylase [Gemmatimonadaceae bacterium]|nr:uracil-DNA glycosylase [Gemmatimonadaceae bacterium]